MNYKYPYIADKKMYAAVMFACKMLRENGYFNKAVEEAAEYYGVDQEKLKLHVRERQAAGQKGKVLGRKYNTCYSRYRVGKYVPLLHSTKISI